MEVDMVQFSLTKKSNHIEKLNNVRFYAPELFIKMEVDYDKKFLFISYCVSDNLIELINTGSLRNKVPVNILR